MGKLFLSGALGLTTLLSAGVAPAVEQPGAAPHESIAATVKALRQSDTEGLIRSLMTADQVDELRSAWDATRREKVDPAERESFRSAMAQLTATGAEKTLLSMVEPQLDEMRPQVSMMVGMISGMGQAAIQQDENLSADDKRMAGEMLNAVVRTLLVNDVTSVRSAERAIGILCGAARKLDLDTLDQVQALDFDRLVKKGDVVLAALKDVFAVYGLSVDKWLDTFRAETVRQSGDRATVRVQFEILGVSQSSEFEMVRSGRQWVREEVLELPMDF